MNDFTKMTDRNLKRQLYDYSKTRKGEIAELTRAAAMRIEELAVKVQELEGRERDDLK